MLCVARPIYVAFGFARPINVAQIHRYVIQGQFFFWILWYRSSKTGDRKALDSFEATRAAALSTDGEAPNTCATTCILIASFSKGAVDLSDLSSDVLV